MQKRQRPGAVRQQENSKPTVRRSTANTDAVAVNEARGDPRVGRSVAAHCVKQGAKPRLGPVDPAPKKGMRSAACAVVLRPRVKNMVRSCTKRREKATGPFSPLSCSF
ncbi:hypothetical protein NDU88_001424 [Pleurodeles waltl]|uniref:Uncharacterized protein n=1 Tax=Pleurodeles waltl TaxID=8319 RepID=A0AAV7P5R6_PLEWA|nr:hypothetical protein NDU88_001424 [Pleurodeles waltl]